MIKIHVLCCNDFPDAVYLSAKAARAAAERFAAHDKKTAGAYGPAHNYHIHSLTLGPPIHLPRRSGGRHWEAQLGRLHFLFNYCGRPMVVRILNKDYGYD